MRTIKAVSSRHGSDIAADDDDRALRVAHYHRRADASTSRDSFAKGGMLRAHANGWRARRLQSARAEIKSRSTMLFGLRRLLISIFEYEDASSFPAICQRAFSNRICSQHSSER
jgi:hypothetical protein